MSKHWDWYCIQLRSALDGLSAGGSTNCGQGIQLAYETAEKNRSQDGVNRIILCTDGDFNVGVTDRSDLIDLIQTEAKRGVFLSVLGFGTGNLKDATMEQLADKGNGNNGYLDSLQEARKLLVEDALGMLLRDSEYSRNVTFKLAHNGIGQSDDNYCQEFLRLTDTAQLLKSLLVTGC